MNYRAFSYGLVSLVLNLILITHVKAGGNVTTNLTHSSAWTSGNWLTMLLTPITDIAGQMAYIIIMLVIIGALYIKSKHTIMITIIGIIFSGVLISLIPKEFQGYIVFLIALAIAVIIYRAFYRNE